MAVTVKRISLWRTDVDNRPGILAGVLEPLAQGGADLRLVMGYRFPNAPEHAAIEVYPVSGRKVTAAAEQAGLAEARQIPCLLVEGDNRPGLGAAMARGLADAGVNIAFLVAQVVGRRFSAAVGFDDENAAGQAVRIIKQAAAARPARRGAGGRRR
jgi:predicted amino acid-binding ACT domain protein